MGEQQLQQPARTGKNHCAHKKTCQRIRREQQRSGGKHPQPHKAQSPGRQHKGTKPVPIHRLAEGHIRPHLGDKIGEHQKTQCPVAQAIFPEQHREQHRRQVDQRRLGYAAQVAGVYRGFIAPHGFAPFPPTPRRGTEGP